MVGPSPAAPPADLVLTGHAVPDSVERRLGAIPVRGLAVAPGFRYARDLLFLVAAYYGAAHLGYALGFTGPVASIVWLPVGVGAGIPYLGGAAPGPGGVA